MKYARTKGIFFAAFLFSILVFPLAVDAFSVAYVTDIHADGKKRTRAEGGSAIYPKNYKRCLEEIKKLKPDLVIAAGDLAEQGQKEYYKKLRGVMEGTQTFWAKGNHDKPSFKYLASENYFSDYGDWRFIVLNSSGKFGSSTGFLEDFQISLLREWLETEKSVAIVMHHPPFFYNSRMGIYTSDRENIYNEFFNSLTPNVRYVFTGHWHFDQRTEIGGTTFLVQRALTQDNKCNYSILNLENGVSDDTESQPEDDNPNPSQ